jgi:hypothetical protein
LTIEINFIFSVDYSKTLPSPKSQQQSSQNMNPPPIMAQHQQQIPISKSQPESLAFLTRSGTAPTAQQNGTDNEGSGIRQSGKRRSSLGSGLLKLFSGRSRDEQPSAASNRSEINN